MVKGELVSVLTKFVKGELIGVLSWSRGTWQLCLTKLVSVLTK